MLQRYAATQRGQLDARPATRKLHRTATAGVAGAAAGAVVGFDGAGFVGAASGGGGGGERPVVSVCVCTTSRNTEFNTLGQLAAIKALALPHSPVHPRTTPCTCHNPHPLPQHTHRTASRPDTAPATPFTVPHSPSQPLSTPLYTPLYPSTPLYTPLHPSVPLHRPVCALRYHATLAAPFPRARIHRRRVGPQLVRVRARVRTRGRAGVRARARANHDPLP